MTLTTCQAVALGLSCGTGSVALLCVDRVQLMMQRESARDDNHRHIIYIR